jgi:hypothetical protein
MLRAHRNLFVTEEEMADEAWDRYIAYLHSDYTY